MSAQALAATQRRIMDAVYGTGTCEPRLDVYRRNVMANLQGALAMTYPVVRRLVGDAFFEETAARFARAHPSRGGDLHEFGAELAAFLEAYAPAAGLAYLPDIARLEWARHESHHAADAGRIDADALARVEPHDQGALLVRLQPALRLVESGHPILAIWEANQPGRDGALARTEGPDRVMVFREHMEVRMCAVAPVEWHLALALLAGATLESAMAPFETPKAIECAGAALAEWVKRGVIAGFSAAGRTA